MVSRKVGRASPGVLVPPCIAMLAWLALACQAAITPAANVAPALQKAALDEALRKGETFWQQIVAAEPKPTAGCRQLLGYALTLCEAGGHAERLQRLFSLARQMQDQDPQSKFWGNLRWYWRDPGVTDANAVEFCMQDALLIDIRHGDRLPHAARKELDSILRVGVEGCLRHRVPTDYTNIAILNAGNLIVLGEQIDRVDALEEGQRRLDALCALSATFGVHEFCSPTYYGTDLNGLLLIHTYARGKRQRQQAEALLQLFWTDIAANWFPGSQRLGGCQSRSYDYLRGIGGLDWHFWVHGWLEAKSAGSAERREPWSEQWNPSPALAEMARQQLPRLVRQHWGILPAESRTQMIYPDVALSCCGAAYGNQDSTLVVDLPGSRDQPRCYFIPDGREDPYGKKKFETGSARHLKALHMQPFWAGAQSGGDALGLVVYRPKDIAGLEVTRLESQFVLRRPDAIWLEGKLLSMPRGSAAKPAEVPIRDGHLVLRYGSAAVGLCARAFCWRDADCAKLVDDGNDFSCLRLVIDHGRRADLAKSITHGVLAAAAFWVRAGSGLRRDADFDSWRLEFEKDLLGAGWEEATEQFVVSLLKAKEKSARLSIEVKAPGSPAAHVKLTPKPYQGVLEVNGRELGLPLLAAIEPLGSHLPAGPLSPLNVPAGKAFYWNAESGLVLPGMAVGNDAAASAGRYVGQEPSPIGQPSGSVFWSLAIEKPGRYWLWARLRSAEGRRGAFSFQAIGEEGLISPEAKWTPQAPKEWHWQRLEFENATCPEALNLPKGVCCLKLQTRQSGTRIDRLMLTSDANERP